MTRIDRAVGITRVVCGACLVAVVMAACTTTQTNPNPSNQIRDPLGGAKEADGESRAKARMDLASAYFGRGQSQVALEQVKLAIGADPLYGPAYNLRGLIYASLGDPALAEESFRRALQINLRDGDSMHNYGWWLCQQGRYGEATAQFERAVAEPRYRGTTRTLLAEGICQARAGQLPAAEATLTKAHGLDPGSLVIATNLGEVLYRRGEFERARFQLRRVNAEKDVSNAQTLWLAARIENKLGNQQGVAEFGNRLRNRFPDSREAAALARDAFDE